MNLRNLPIAGHDALGNRLAPGVPQALMLALGHARWELAKRCIEQALLRVFDDLRFQRLVVPLHDDARRGHALPHALAHQLDVSRCIRRKRVEPGDVIFIVALRGKSEVTRQFRKLDVEAVAIGHRHEMQLKLEIADIVAQASAQGCRNSFVRLV